MGRKILLAVNESKSTDDMLKWAIEDFLRPTDSILLVHIYENKSEIYMADLPLTSHAYDQTDKALLKDGEAFLKKIQGILSQSGFKVENGFLRNDGNEQIVEVATQEKVKALLVGSRGLGPLERSFLGSTSDYCVHHASCPVIVVKSQNEK